MVAAEKNPLTDTGTPDLTLDILPGESVEQAKAHQETTPSLNFRSRWMPLNCTKSKPPP